MSSSSLDILRDAATVASELAAAAANADSDITGRSAKKRRTQSRTSPQDLNEGDSDLEDAGCRAGGGGAMDDPDSDNEGSNTASPLDLAVLESSMLVFGDKRKLDPAPWVVNAKYHSVAQLSAIPADATFSVFLNAQEIAVFRVVGQQKSTCFSILQLVAIKGGSAYPTLVLASSCVV